MIGQTQPKTNLITIKPETASHVSEQSSWVPFPYCSPPGEPLPNKVSCLVSTWVSVDNSLLNVRQEPTRGPGRGPPSCNSFDPWLVEPTDADKLQIQRAYCTPSSSWNAPRKNVQRPTVLQSRLKQGCQSSCLPRAGRQAGEMTKAGWTLEKQQMPEDKWEAVGRGGDYGELGRTQYLPAPITAMWEYGPNAARTFC